MAVAGTGLQRGLFSRAIALSPGGPALQLGLAIDVNAVGHLISTIGHGVHTGAGPDLRPDARCRQLGNLGWIGRFLDRV